jgi:cell wall-associated NlpC family hydrolase
MTTADDVKQIGREIDKIVNQLIQGEKAVTNTVKAAKTIKGGPSIGGSAPSFGGLSSETQQVMNKYLAMGGGGGSGIMATSLGVVTAGVGALWNSVPGVDDAYTYKQQIFNTAYANRGQFSADKTFGMIKASFGAGMDATSVLAASNMTNAGIGPNSTRFMSTGNQAGMLSRFDGRSTQQTTAGMISLQNGSSGISGKLASYGIFVTDPGSGKGGDLGKLVDQLWARWYGSKNARVDDVQFEADLMGGWVGSDMTTLFGSYPDLYQNVLSALRMKQKSGGRSINWNVNKNGKDSANRQMTKAGIKTEDTPWWAKQSMEQGRMENIADSSDALIKGFQDAAAVVNKFNEVMNAFINSGAGQLAFRGKGFLDSVTGSQELGGAVGFGGSLLGSVLMGGAMRAGFGAIGGAIGRGAPKVIPFAASTTGATGGSSAAAAASGTSSVAGTVATASRLGRFAKFGGPIGAAVGGALTAIPLVMAANEGYQSGGLSGAASNYFGAMSQELSGPGGVMTAGPAANAMATITAALSNLFGSGGDQVSVVPGGAEEGAGGGSLTSSSSGSNLAKMAMGYLGVRYVAGGRDAKSGWDCAGFTYALYKKLGVILPEVSWLQIKKGTPVASLSEALPGDLLFFHVKGGHNHDPSPLKVNHVGVFIDSKTMVHAANPKSGTVKTSLPYSGGKLVGIRRYLDPTKLSESQQKLFDSVIGGSAGGSQGGASTLGIDSPMSSGFNSGGFWGSVGSIISTWNDSSESPNDASASVGGVSVSTGEVGTTVPSSNIGESSLAGITPGRAPKLAWSRSPLGDAALIGVLSAAGFQGEDLREAYAIAMRESSGNPTSHNPRGQDYSYGLFQINMLGSLGPERDAKFRRYVRGYNGPDSLFDPIVNARAAAYMSQKGRNWASWVSPTYGKAKQYYAQYPGASSGMDMLKDGLVNAHQGEIIVPAEHAGPIREIMRKGIDGLGKTNNITINVNVKNASREEATRFAKWIKQDLQHESVIDRMRSK